MFKPLQGRTVIVTGARRGIGRGIAKRFGKPGLYVLMVSRNLDEAETAAAEVGANASAFAADVTDPVSCWSRGVAPVSGSVARSGLGGMALPQRKGGPARGQDDRLDFGCAAERTCHITKRLTRNCFVTKVRSSLFNELSRVGLEARLSQMPTFSGT
jgi:hypothetical protein